MSNSTNSIVNLSGGTPSHKNISELLLDEGNPRFGEIERGADQAQLVDLIINKFGIEDVLNSLAINGFFAAEPLVCVRRSDGTLVVKEGNRRLCACIVLTGDPRAVRQQGALAEKAKKLWQSNNRPQIEPIPVLIFEEDGSEANTMLSYLGVRHISSAQPWDSYAKASWIAKITEETDISVSKITEMIGDQHSTVIRLLEGYQFIQQLIGGGYFRPEDSQRRGRGSVAEYPFSWVYTILGFKSARDFCGLSEITGKSNPIPEDRLPNAATVVESMFGNRAKGRSAAIVDSRQLSELARAFSDVEKVSLLREGKDLVAVLDATKPIEIKLEENLSQVRAMLADLVSSISEAPPVVEVAQKHLGVSLKTRQLAADLVKRLKEIVDREFETNDD